MFLENFLVIGQQVIVLFILIAVGFICGKKGVITEHASKVMTDIVLYAVTPCVMVSAFQREFSMETLGKVLTAAVTALVILAVSVLIARLVFRQKDIARRKRSCSERTAGSSARYSSRCSTSWSGRTDCST